MPLEFQRPGTKILAFLVNKKSEPYAFEHVDFEEFEMASSSEIRRVLLFQPDFKMFLSDIVLRFSVSNSELDFSYIVEAKPSELFSEPPQNQFEKLLVHYPQPENSRNVDFTRFNIQEFLEVFLKDKTCFIIPGTSKSNTLSLSVFIERIEEEIKLRKYMKAGLRFQFAPESLINFIHKVKSHKIKSIGPVRLNIKNNNRSKVHFYFEIYHQIKNLQAQTEYIQEQSTLILPYAGSLENIQFEYWVQERKITFPLEQGVNCKIEHGRLSIQVQDDAIINQWRLFNTKSKSSPALAYDPEEFEKFLKQSHVLGIKIQNELDSFFSDEPVVNLLHYLHSQACAQEIEKECNSLKGKIQWFIDKLHLYASDRVILGLCNFYHLYAQQFQSQVPNLQGVVRLNNDRISTRPLTHRSLNQILASLKDQSLRIFCFHITPALVENNEHLESFEIDLNRRVTGVKVSKSFELTSALKEVLEYQRFHMSYGCLELYTKALTYPIIEDLRNCIYANKAWHKHQYLCFSLPDLFFEQHQIKIWTPYSVKTINLIPQDNFDISPQHVWRIHVEEKVLIADLLDFHQQSVGFYISDCQSYSRHIAKYILSQQQLKNLTGPELYLYFKLMSSLRLSIEKQEDENINQQIEISMFLQDLTSDAETPFHNIHKAKEVLNSLCNKEKELKEIVKLKPLLFLKQQGQQEKPLPIKTQFSRQNLIQSLKANQLEFNQIDYAPERKITIRFYEYSKEKQHNNSKRILQKVKGTISELMPGLLKGLESLSHRQHTQFAIRLYVHDSYEFGFFDRLQNYGEAKGVRLNATKIVFTLSSAVKLNHGILKFFMHKDDTIEIKTVPLIETEHKIKDTYIAITVPRPYINYLAIQVYENKPITISPMLQYFRDIEHIHMLEKLFNEADFYANEFPLIKALQSCTILFTAWRNPPSFFNELDQNQNFIRLLNALTNDSQEHFHLVQQVLVLTCQKLYLQGISRHQKEMLAKLLIRYCHRLHTLNNIQAFSIQHLNTLILISPLFKWLTPINTSLLNLKLQRNPFLDLELCPIENNLNVRVQNQYRDLFKTKAGEQLLLYVWTGKSAYIHPQSVEIVEAIYSGSSYELKIDRDLCAFGLFFRTDMQDDWFSISTPTPPVYLNEKLIFEFLKTFQWKPHDMALANFLMGAYLFQLSEVIRHDGAMKEFDNFMRTLMNKFKGEIIVPKTLTSQEKTYKQNIQKLIEQYQGERNHVTTKCN